MKIHKPHPGPQGTVAGLVGTIVVHAGAVFFLVAAVKPARPSPPSYAVDLVAAPAPTTKRRLAREALPTPPPEEKPAPTPPKPAPPKDKPAPVTPKPREAGEDGPCSCSQAAAGGKRARACAANGSTRWLRLRARRRVPARMWQRSKLPGLAFPYPEYLRNIVTQVYQRWDRASAKQSNFAEISFLILRDGSVRDIRLRDPLRQLCL